MEHQEANKMGMQMEIISINKIKPAKPTAHHLKTHKVSLLDQLVEHAYVPLVLFYANDNFGKFKNNEHLDIRFLLKQSLSKTLVSFYPLAGKVKDDMQIECNDDGIHYVEVQIHCELSNFLSPKPNNRLIHNLLPFDPCSKELAKMDFVVMVQVNFFECGSIAIGIYSSHKIIDGHSILTFLKSWACESSSRKHVDPDFTTSPLIFIPSPKLPKELSLTMWPTLFGEQPKCVTRRFVFDASALATLRAKVQPSTRVMAVMGLIWKTAMVASNTISGFRKPSIFTFSMNLRPRHSPPLSPYSLGNIMWNTAASYDCDTDLEVRHVIARLRSAVEKVNDKFIEEIKGEGGVLKLEEKLRELKEKYYSNKNALYLGCTSLCNGGLYEVDFGWGRPIWSRPSSFDTGLPIATNYIALMDTKTSVGIEAWVSLEEHLMALFECDPELLAFSSLDPGPL
ncbi:stemmadenine O-acetyltransferase-like [Lycium ferocissimum]|uniref:stemmadenine O-acetyltransferase-like n=1 Tax=Lycium ferocissimum TaxID=112874 RepID=UPI002814C288|nr:stemmadenine O-acetyltransferase-like [Lycium ferocissimum]